MTNFSPIVYLIVIVSLAWWLWRSLGREKTLAQEMEKRKRQREAVYRFLDLFGARLTTGTLTVEPALELVTTFVAEQTDAEAAAAFLVDNENKLSARVVHGMFPPLIPSTNYVLTKQRFLTERIKREKISMGEGIIGEVAQSGEAVLIKDAALDPRVPKMHSPVVAVRTIMVAPLVAHGRTLGVLAVVNKRGVGAFKQEDLDLLVTLADQAASTVELVRLTEENAEKQRLEQELKLAHDIQQMLLPDKCPQLEGFSIAAFSSPAMEVGGDYYDFIWVDEEKRYLGVAIADVSGKGIPGALIMTVVRCTMRATAPGNMSPRDVLIRVNERVYADTGENVFVTITYGILDVAKRSFTFVRAGHEPLVMIGQTSNLSLSSPTGIAMGLVEADLFSIIEERTVTFTPGDTAIFYTDGVVEAMDRENREYGQKRFFDLIESNRNSMPQEIIKKTLDDISSFIGDNPQHDDITLVALRLDTPVDQAVSDSSTVSRQEVLPEQGIRHEQRI